ncbi:MAG: hypothetical protein KAX50_00520 [Saprospiraceae bacterium]|nr:hypothetical protein [Saprospiraceae bacterium]
MQQPYSTWAGMPGLLLLYVLFSSLSVVPPMPPPECVGQLTVVLQPEDTNNDGTPDAGLATILATDLVVNPLPPPVQYSLRIYGQLPDIERYGLVLDCDFTNAFDPGGTPIGFTVDVWENGALVDSCSTTVYVQDQLGICVADEPFPFICGMVRTEEQMPVNNVYLQATWATQNWGDITDTSGQYCIYNIYPYIDITVTPYGVGNPRNGVSILDAILIQRHILSVAPLNSPFKRIAADVNQSGNISLMDVIILRRLILHVLDELPNDRSWRFIPTSYQFPVPANPWFEQFPETIYINELSGNSINRNFTAIKLGDVNGSAGGE